MTLLIRQDDLSTFSLDCTESERYGASIVVTEHPVEIGAPITDHARPEQLAITLTGRVTQSPWSTMPGPAGPGRLAAALAWLRASEGRLLDVVTDRLGTVQNCLLTAYPHEISSRRDLPITLSLRQVRLAAALFTAIPATGPKRPAPPAENGQPDEASAGVWSLFSGDASLGAIGVDGAKRLGSTVGSYLGWP